METDFKVKVGEFEGPLELLLDLIEKRKLHINSVSLSQVADDFIEHIKVLEEFPMADSADFILIASTLLLIKSKSLLPNLELTSEEEGSIGDLEERLREYQKYKVLTLQIQKMFGHFLFFADEPKNRLVVFAPSKELGVESLYRAMAELLQNLPKPRLLPQVIVEKVISLEEMISALAERVQKSFKMSFSSFIKASNSAKASMDKSADGKDFATSKGDKINVIVSFLAMLELVKRGAMRVSQQNHFADIEMESENLNTPTYS